MVSRDRPRPDLQVPSDWKAVGERMAGPFITGVTYERPDGRRLHWQSRRHRKGLGLRPAGTVSWRRGSWLLGTHDPNWWIGVLFLVGSVLFSVGSLPGYAEAAGDAATAATFFVGSGFFTAAAYLQFLQAVNAPREITDQYLPGPRWLRPISLEPRRIDWWVTVVQLAGTVLFNVTTYQGLTRAAPAPGTDIFVWFPNWLGSVCFLVASYLALVEVCPRVLCRPRETETWIVAVNMVGSLFFMASALGGLMLPDGEVLSARLVAAGTFLGAVCFGVGAVLLMREAPEKGPGAASAPTATAA